MGQEFGSGLFGRFDFGVFQGLLSDIGVEGGRRLKAKLH